jgi:hypothetical protein
LKEKGIKKGKIVDKEIRHKKKDITSPVCIGSFSIPFFYHFSVSGNIKIMKTEAANDNQDLDQKETIWR